MLAILKTSNLYRKSGKNSKSCEDFDKMNCAEIFGQ